MGVEIGAEWTSPWAEVHWGTEMELSRLSPRDVDAAVAQTLAEVKALTRQSRELAEASATVQRDAAEQARQQADERALELPAQTARQAAEG